MSIIVGIILALLTLAYVVYPFFKSQQEQAAAPTSRIKLRSTKKIDDDIENQILKLRQKKGNPCPKCGAANQADARFCCQCAASLVKGK